MSMPVIKSGEGSRCQAVTDIIESVALEQTALSHILNAEGEKIQAILEEPEEYIDSREFFSWERYFTRLLVDKTEQSYLKYKKARLNERYLHEKNKQTILKSIKGLKL